MNTALEIPIFPLGAVLYPAGLLPLRIFEPRYVEMTRNCIAGRSVFGVSLIRAGFEVGKPAVPCELGCTARILRWSEPQPDRYTLLAQGESVFRILRRGVLDSGLIMAEVELREPPDPVPLPARHEHLRDRLAALIERLGAERFPSPRRLDDAAWLGYRLCELLPVEPERKQALLEMADPLVLLDEVERVLLGLGEEGGG